MKHKAFIAIDPGANGAICCLVPELDIIRFIKTDLDAVSIRDWIINQDSEFEIINIMIEDVHSLFGMSAKSNFTFGGNVRYPRTIFETLGFYVSSVQPKVWQKAINLGKVERKKIKFEVALICRNLYPESEIFNSRGTLLDGRSDSLMIAHYSYLLHKGELTCK